MAGIRRSTALLVALVVTAVAASVAASPQCDGWQLVNPLPVEHDLLGSTSGNGLFVVVGRQGTVLVSPDEMSWRLVEAPTEQDLHDVTWTGETFVAVGAAGTVLTSADGSSWTSRPTPNPSNLAAVAAGPRLLAVGGGGVVVSSSDGAVWELEESGTQADLRDVAWTGSEFMAVGADPRILASGDGSAWAWRDLDQASDLSCIAGNGESTVVIAEDGSSWVTADGVDWSRGSTAHGLTDIVWAGDRYVAAGGPGYYGPRYSRDGLSWSYGHNTAPGLRLRTVTSDGAAIVAAGVGGAVAVTRDGGQHFKPANTPTGLHLYGVAGVGQTRVAAAGTESAAHGAILASDDALNWEVVYDMGAEALYDVAEDGSVFVAVGVINELWDGGAMILRSADGRSWGGAVGNVTGPGEWPWEWQSITWDGGRFVVAGSGGAVAIGSNASSWHLIGGSAVTDHTFLGVASDGVRIVAVGSTGVIAVSPDGESLTIVRPGYEDRDLTDVAWGNGAFVAVGSDGVVLTSADGEHWQDRVSGVAVDLEGVRFTGGEFVAVGAEGTVLTSSDGAAWQGMDSTGPGTLLDALVTESELVAVGENGLVLRSVCSAEGEPPIPSFAWRPTLPEEGVPVRFSDLSIGAPTVWHWDFGDGTTADASDVTHTYDAAGEWPVTLTVENAAGSATAAAEVTVRRFCGAPPRAGISAPASAASGRPYEIEWSETIQPDEFGEYILVESTDPDFTETEAWGFWAPRDSFTLSHEWREGASFFYRVQSINYCPDGSYRSELSSTARVDIDPDLSELGEHLRLIAAAAHGPGLGGTSWVSDVVIHNPHPSAAPAYLYLLQREGAGPPVASSRYWIEPGRSLAIADAVGGLQSPGYGALLVASDRPLVVGSRTYNDSPAGTFGQSIEGADPSGEPVLRLIQLTQNERFRTNLALANPRSEPVDLDVELFAADGGLLAERAYTLPALSSMLDVEVLAGVAAGDLDDAFAVVSSEMPGADYVALASVVDSISGDPVAQPAIDGRLHHRIVVHEEVPVIRDSGWNDILFAGDVYVAAGTRALAWSRDGVDWHRASGFDPPATLWDLEWNGHEILAVGPYWAYSSSDGTAWRGVSFDHHTFSSVTWDGTRWVAIGGGGGIYTEVGFSPDGLTWELQQLADLHLRTIVWAGDRFVAAGRSGIATSVDALSWEIVHEIDGGIKGLVWNGRELIALGPRELYVSADLQHFDRRDFTWEPDEAVWAGDRWVVAASSDEHGRDDVFLVSVDGSDWEAVPNPGPYLHPAEGIAWDGAAVLAVDFRKRLTWLVSDGPDVTVLAAAHLPGYRGSSWRSDLELHNPGTEPAACSLSLLERDVANTSPRRVEVTVAPGSSRRLRDVVANEFQHQGAAAIAVDPGNQPILVSSRTFNDGAAGTYGQLVPGLRTSAAIHGFETGRLIQLRHSPRLDSGYRTNIGLVSRCDVEMEVAVELHMGSGDLLGRRSAVLPPRGVTQLNNVFEAVTEEPVADGFAVLWSGTQRCPFFAYASVVDNRTHDPILVRAVPWTPDR